MLSSDGRHSLHHTWHHADNPRAQALLLHDFDQSSAHMLPYIKRLNAVGISCLSYDMLGHGQTADERLIHPKHPAAMLKQDAYLMQSLLDTALPWVLLGAGFGACLGLSYLSHHAFSYRACALWHLPTPRPTDGIMLDKLGAKALPIFKNTAPIDRLGVRLTIERQAAKALTHDTLALSGQNTAFFLDNPYYLRALKRLNPKPITPNPDDVARVLGGIF